MYDSDSGIQNEIKLVSGVENVFPLKPESSFDSGYSSSPVKFNFGISPAPSSQTNPRGLSIMDQNRPFIASPLRNHNTDSNQCIISLSPVKIEPGLFSPFKGSSLSPFKDATLSPFKLINQSPSKGAFDEWDKDFIASFQENLFGDVTGNPSIVDEWLRSPQGKAALLESKNSPLRHGGNAVRRLKISPENKNRKQNFQPLHDHNVEIFSAPVYIKDDPYDSPLLKTENTSHDHMYGQSTITVNANTLSAIDPNKMGATPIKPRFTNMENAPIRKLSMRIPGVVGGVPTVLVQQKEYHSENTWPSKEKLKFARLQFQQILNKAVEDELEIRKEQKRRKAELIKRQSGKHEKKSKCDKLVVHKSGNVTKAGHKHGGKVSKGAKTKGKTSRKAGRKDRYPQIKMALSNPVKNEEMSPLVHRELFPPAGFTDPGWYPSEDEAETEDETWSGPPPLFKQSSVEVYQQNNDSSDEDWAPSGYQYETLSGRKVKKRKLY